MCARTDKVTQTCQGEFQNKGVSLKMIVLIDVFTLDRLSLDRYINLDRWIASMHSHILQNIIMHTNTDNKSACLCHCFQNASVSAPSDVNIFILEGVFPKGLFSKTLFTWLRKAKSHRKISF